MKKYGKKVYDGSNSIRRKCIGRSLCPACGQESVLIKQKGYGFENILSICSLKHTVEIDKRLFSRFKVGDRVRLYESTFGKDAVLKLDSYTEGIVIKSYADLIDYKFDFLVDRCVMNGQEITAPAWVIGSTHYGVNHSSTEVELLKTTDR